MVNKGTQPGDPAKAGKVIVAQVQSGSPLPVRLLLGSDAVKVVRAEMEGRITEIDAWAEVSAQTDF